MDKETFEIRVRGKTLHVPAQQVDGRTVVVLGKWLKIARVHDEDWIAGQVVSNPDVFIGGLRQTGRKADIFTFCQKLPDTEPRYSYPFEMDNYAVAHFTSLAQWWEQQIPQESRKNVRRCAKRGVVVRRAQLDDALIEGIVQIYNETPFRQGKRFPHFGKDFATTKKEVSTIMDRSEFIGAYFGDELIGFIKLVYLGNIASILHIVSKNEHYDKRPSNALIAKAVELCAEKSISYLLYGHYTYGNKTSSPLAEFKRRNGFKEVKVPRYYVPLSVWGKAAVQMRLYRGVLGILPPPLLVLLVRIRAWFLRSRLSQESSSGSEANAGRPTAGKRVVGKTA